MPPVRVILSATTLCFCCAVMVGAGQLTNPAQGADTPGATAATQPGAAAHDWPQYPGPGQTAASTESGWIAAWPDSPPPVLWESEVGAGCSSFVVVGNRLYTQGCFPLSADRPSPASTSGPATAPAKAQRLYREDLLCYDIDTGAVMWRQVIREPVTVGGGRSTNATPACNDGNVYGHGLEGDLICCNAETGAVLWRADLKASLGVLTPRDGNASSPAIAGDTLLIIDPLPRDPPPKEPWRTAWAAVLAFDKKTGAARWQVTYQASGQSYGTWSTCVVANIDHRETVVASLNDHLAGIDLATGAKLWDINYLETIPGVKEVKGGNQYPSVCPWYAGQNRIVDRLWSSTGKGSGGINRTFCLEIKDGKASVVWVNPGFAAMINGFCPAGGFLYGIDGRHVTMNNQNHVEDAPMLQCLDLATGVRQWGTDEFLPEELSGKPTNRTAGLLTQPPTFLLVDGKLIGWNGQYLSVTGVSPKGYQLLAAFRVLEKKSYTWSMPVFARGRLFLRPHAVLTETQYTGPSFLCYDFRPVRSVVAAPGLRGAVVRFNKPLDRASAEKITNYQLDHGAVVEQVKLDAAGTSVTLVTSKLSENERYTLQVGNVSGRDATVLPTATIGFAARTLVPGLTGEYFDQPDLAGKVEHKMDQQIDFPQGFKPGVGNGSVRWTGKIKPKVSASYTFTVDDNTRQRVWVDGKLVIGQYEMQRPYTAPITLLAGQMYDLRMEVYAGGGRKTALRWSSPSLPAEIVPAEVLYTASQTER